jgi:CheY-like chemotaxis protein
MNCMIMPTRRILTVDDDRATCAHIQAVLEREGYIVDAAYDATTALHLVDRNEYDLVILDYMMPGMNGIELFRLMRKLRPGVVGAFITGYASIDTVYPAVAAGVSRVLGKPVEQQQLLAITQELLGEGEESGPE